MEWENGRVVPTAMTAGETRAAQQDWVEHARAERRRALPKLWGRRWLGTDELKVFD